MPLPPQYERVKEARPDLYRRVRAIAHRVAQLTEDGAPATKTLEAAAHVEETLLALVAELLDEQDTRLYQELKSDVGGAVQAYARSLGPGPVTVPTSVTAIVEKLLGTETSPKEPWTPDPNKSYLDQLFEAAKECTGDSMPDMWEPRGLDHLNGRCDCG